MRVAAIAFEIEEGMIVTDKDEMIIRVNRVFTELSGYRAEEAIGKHLRMLKSNNNEAGFYERMTETLHCSNTWRGRTRTGHKQGQS